MKQFMGIVKSTKMNKTIVVEVKNLWLHPKYKKTVTKTKKYLVHDEKEEAKVGNKVKFSEVAPISKNKRFKLISVVGK